MLPIMNSFPNYRNYMVWQFDVQNTSLKHGLPQKICSFDTNSNIAMVNVSERTFRGTKNVQNQTQFTFCLQQNSSTQRGVVCFEQCLPQQSIQQRFRNGSLLATGLLARYLYNCTYIYSTEQTNIYVYGISQIVVELFRLIHWKLLFFLHDHQFIVFIPMLQVFFSVEIVNKFEKD